VIIVGTTHSQGRERGLKRIAMQCHMHHVAGEMAATKIRAKGVLGTRPVNALWLTTTHHQLQHAMQIEVLPTDVMADRLPMENSSANFRALSTITGISINDCRVRGRERRLLDTRQFASACSTTWRAHAMPLLLSCTFQFTWRDQSMAAPQLQRERL
jgi:hypothetical protein